jgi:hypothetical protein
MNNRSKFRIAAFIMFSFVALNNVNAQVVSDKKVMKNVTPLSDPLPALNLLEPLQYEYNRDAYKHLSLPEGRYYGFDAQEVQKVLPAAVKTSRRSYMAGKNLYKTATVKTIDYESLIPLLIASAKQQQVEIELLKKEIQQLKERK